MKLTNKQIVELTKKIIKESIGKQKSSLKENVPDPTVMIFLKKFNFQPFDNWYKNYDRFISGDLDPEDGDWQDFQEDTLGIMRFLKRSITNTMNEADGMSNNTRMGVEFMRIVVEEITPELKKAIADLKKKDVTLKNKIYKLIGPKDKIIYNEAGNKIVIDCLGDEAGTRSKKVKEELEKHSSKVKTRKEKRLTAIKEVTINDDYKAGYNKGKQDGYEKGYAAAKREATPHKKFKDEYGNTDWRDTGEMGG